MSAALRAGSLYFATIFALGALLGTLRTLVLAPAFGPLAATAAELPLMLAASWIVAGRLSRPLGPAFGPRLAMGLFAFALLMVAEAALGAALGVDPLARFASPEGRLGFAAQCLFAAFPALRRPDRRPVSRRRP